MQDTPEYMHYATVIFSQLTYSLWLLSRSALPKYSEEQCKQIFEQGQRTEQEFAEHFTGKFKQHLNF